MAELLVEHKNLKLHGEQVLSILLVKSIVAINERDLYPSQIPVPYQPLQLLIKRGWPDKQL